jgi:hypothetical protein
MSNERINLTQTEKEAAEAFRKGWHADPHRVPRVPLINYQRELIEELIAELKRCYDLIDRLTDPNDGVLCPECGEITDDQSHHQYCTASE